MSCKHCCSQELMNVTVGHQGDFKLTSVNTGEVYRGTSIYLPPITISDQNLEFTICVSCGQISGKWKFKVNKLLEKSHATNYEIIE